MSCYLIRSLQEGHTNKTYVGSTPEPIRRLRQHNGELTQGAYRNIYSLSMDFLVENTHFNSNVRGKNHYKVDI
ncbi:hypothetical protein MFLAVUS_001103 [Mucor flavus]|uniref:GIY-YIG domain-containing protein n=1 Tax=Mucor flavus TaxID=439312 RepID=A0ABP9YLI7_9FUNG